MDQYAFLKVDEIFRTNLPCTNGQLKEGFVKLLADELNTAWELIASAGRPQGNWKDCPPNWVDAASKWRNKRMPTPCNICPESTEDHSSRFVMELRKKAELYENQARVLQNSGRLHEMHAAFDNARALRMTANILDVSQPYGHETCTIGS